MSERVKLRRSAGRRILALMRKETAQLLRDPASIAIGIVMPLVLLVLFGYGISLDVRNVRVAVVVHDTSEEARGLVGAFELSDYFEPVAVRSMAEAETLLVGHSVRAIVQIPQDFTRRLLRGGADVLVIVHGADANTARITQGYAQGAVTSWLAREAARSGSTANGAIDVESRLWFNEANDSTHFLVPGIVVMVMTLIGGLLTAMVMAREWERGTFEAMFVTPVRPAEILLGKVAPYFVLGMIGLALSVVGSQVLFGVPLRGSVLVLAGVSMLYLLVALGIGLVISSATKSQFVASQMTMVITFLPAMMLSGFMFDLRSMPWVIQIVTYIFPARYFVSLLQTLFLAGNVWSVVIPNAAVLALMALVLMALAARLTAKRIG